MYTGKGVIPQGYGDPLNSINNFAHTMKRNKEKHLSLKLFKHLVTMGDAILKGIPDSEKKIKALYDLITSYASDPAKGLKRKELKKVPMRIWAKVAAEGDHEGPLPCDHGEEYILDDNEAGKITDYLTEVL